MIGTYNQLINKYEDLFRQLISSDNHGAKQEVEVYSRQSSALYSKQSSVYSANSMPFEHEHLLMTLSSNALKDDPMIDETELYAEKRLQGTVGFKLYLSYFLNGFGLAGLVTVFILFTMAQFSWTFTNYWLSKL